MAFIAGMSRALPPAQQSGLHVQSVCWTHCSMAVGISDCPQ